MQDLCRLSVVLSGAGDFRTDTKGVPCIAKRGTVYLFYKKSKCRRQKADAWQGRHRVFARPGTDDKRRGA